MQEEDSLLGFNFWPTFADSMLAIVLILAVVLVLVVQHGLDPTVRESQQKIIMSIAGGYDGTLDTLQQSPTQSKYAIQKEGDNELEIRQDMQLQRITFRGNVLFSENDFNLTDRGKGVLQVVGEAISPQLDLIDEVQIEGHTDSVRTEWYEEGNLELGARRAMSVFRFLEEKVGIDPARNLMSATSYGPFRPVGRSRGETYNEDDLRKANNTSEKRKHNRRIELLLFYGDDSADEES